MKDQGALVIDVQEETDTKEIPPCMIQKSDGASLLWNNRPCHTGTTCTGLSSGQGCLCGG